jgi:hypothetical protein
MTERKCGTCSRCCFTFKLPELHKPAHVWCRFCDHENGKGCKIYTDPRKPEICSTYKCMWLDGTLPEEAHPNRLGAYFSWSPKQSWLVNCFLDSDRSASAPAVEDVIDVLHMAGLDVRVIQQGQRNQYLAASRRKPRDAGVDLFRLNGILAEKIRFDLV